MSSRAQQILQAGSHLKVELTAGEWQQRERALRARLARRTQRRRLALLATLIVAPLVAVSSVWLLRGHHSAPLAGSGTVGPPEAGGALRPAVALSDGSQLQASTDADWHERVSGEAATRQVEVQVRKGRVRLSVVPHRPQEFRVVAGDVRVEVIGTVFSVERRGETVAVAVEHGRVQVTRAGEPATFLGAGETHTFTHAAQAEATPSVETEAVPEPETKASSSPKPSASPGAGWQALAREGEYAAAYQKMQQAQVADVPGDLLLSADVARLSGHPARAIAPLRRVAEGHAGDPRAPLAAFTLGRVYLEDLGNPRDAAAAFRLTRSLQPGGPMAETALAREVEALARAGETERSRALAREYLARYPSGSKRKLVLRHAGEP